MANKIYKTIMITKIFLGLEHPQEVVTGWLFEQDILTPPFKN